MDIYDKAVVFAVNAHAGQNRKSGGTYIVHPLETSVIAETMTDDLNVLAAAVLHDTVEDTSVEAKDIEREFGSTVAALVASETENKRHGQDPSSTWRIRKEESLAVLKSTDNLNVKILWLSDKLSNMRSFYRSFRIHGKELWQRFNEKDPKVQYWYYRTVADLTTELKDTTAWIEYNELIRRIFREEES